MKAYPRKLQLASDNVLQIEWDDGQRTEYSVQELRDNCPCATCRQETGRQIESPAEGPDDRVPPEESAPLTITGMKPVGHYAYAITFSDGHDLGMFTLEQLRVMGRERKPGDRESGDG